MGEPPARIGDPLGAVETPALVVDLDAFDRNLGKMARFAEEAGIGLRPHAKMHRSAEVARRQMAAGAVGLSAQTVGEAEALVRGGIGDVLVTNEVVSPAKLARLAALAREVRIGLCFDSADAVTAASDAARHAGTVLAGLVEIEVGMGRCGAAPGSAARDLARRIADAPGLRFAGLQAYHGRAQHLHEPADRERAIAGAVEAVRATLACLHADGLACEIVGGAGTGTFRLEAASGVYTEIQPGSYLFMDGEYAGIGGGDGRGYREFEHALFVLATVMSEAGRDFVVLDAGLKSCSAEKGLPGVYGRPGLEVVGCSDEHAKVSVAPGAPRPRLRDQVALIPGHCDPTVNLHDWIVAVRHGQVEALWRVDARGASR